MHFDLPQVNMKSNIMVEQMINPIFEVVAGMGYFDNIIVLQVHTKITVCSVSTCSHKVE